MSLCASEVLVDERTAGVTTGGLAAVVRGVAVARDQPPPQGAVDAMRAILAGKRGVRPDTAFDIGEGLYEAGLRWMSGLLALALVLCYHPHAIGLIGVCMAQGNGEDLRGMWPGFSFITRFRGTIGHKGELPIRGGERVWGRPTKYRGFEETIEVLTSHRSALTWSEAQHKLLRSAWKHWMDSKESTTEMDESFRLYTMLWRLPLKDEEFYVIEDAALRFMREFFDRKMADSKPIPSGAQRRERQK
jgi:hypothetical protein